MDQLKFAVVCANNLNRSMAIHAHLSEMGFQVRSFGSSDKVRLPGRNTTHDYDFEVVPYQVMYEHLLKEDEPFYTRNGILQMLDRNRKIKSHPERFQDCYEKFDIIFTVNNRVYQQVLEELQTRSPRQDYAVHVINIEVKDTRQAATSGAVLIGEMATKMAESKQLGKEIDDVIQEFEKRLKTNILFTYLV